MCNDNYRRREQERLDRDRQYYQMLSEMRAKYSSYIYDTNRSKPAHPSQTPASDDIRQSIDKSHLRSSLRNMVSHSLNPPKIRQLNISWSLSVIITDFVILSLLHQLHFHRYRQQSFTLYRIIKFQRQPELKANFIYFFIAVTVIVSQFHKPFLPMSYCAC